MSDSTGKYAGQSGHPNRAWIVGYLRKATESREDTPERIKSNPLREVPAAIENRPAGTSLASARRPAAWSLVAGFSVEKAFVGLGFLVAFTVIVLFGLDLICTWPIGRDTPTAEAVFCICGAVLGYLSWNTYRDLR